MTKATPGVAVIEVTAHYEIVINLGNWEKATIGAWAKVTIDPATATPEQGQAVAFETAKESVKAQALPLLAKRQKMNDSIWEGLPESVKKQFESRY